MTHKGWRAVKPQLNQNYQLHMNDKVKIYSRLFWSTEACWQISQFPIDWNAERCINGAQDIFSV